MTVVSLIVAYRSFGKFRQVRHPPRYAAFLTPPSPSFGHSSRDLSGANLAGADLMGANLRGATLAAANLRGADLRGANLRRAALGGINFRNATLEGGADLGDAKLWAADLGGADLGGARNLTQQQVDTTCCDEATKLPPGLKPGSACRR
jgi:uncharacterized protein YjbI with pentapeptide repeats